MTGPSMHQRALLALAAALTLPLPLVAGCAIHERTLEIGECTPDESRSCGCANGVEGHQTCSAAGDGWEACWCPGLADGVYTAGDYRGEIWTATDRVGSSVDPPCNGGACFTNRFCVRGTAVQVPLVNGAYDFSNGWGVTVGWNLSMRGSAERNPPVSVAQKSKLTVGVQHHLDASAVSLRVTLLLPQSDNKNGSYCQAIGRGDRQEIKLSDLRAECWNAGGTRFDPATMQPEHVELTVLATTDRNTPFDYCVTDFSLE